MVGSKESAGNPGPSETRIYRPTVDRRSDGWRHIEDDEQDLRIEGDAVVDVGTGRGWEDEYVHSIQCGTHVGGLLLT